MSDIIRVPAFLPPDVLEKINLAYNEARFAPIERKWIPKNVADYYADGDSPLIHWIPVGSAVDELIKSNMTRAIALLNETYLCMDIRSDEGYRFNKYLAGQRYKLHVDRSNVTPVYARRYVSVIINLNDNYEGGEVFFPRQEKKIALGKGDLLLFPSSYTHPHEVMTVTKGERRSIVSWLN